MSRVPTGFQTESERTPTGVHQEVMPESAGFPVRENMCARLRVQSTEFRASGYASHDRHWSARDNRRPVDNSLAAACPTMRCEEDRIIHLPGIANPRWPLCHEAVARIECAWSDVEIADGELSCCWDILVAGIDTERDATCDACREWAHA